MEEPKNVYNPLNELTGIGTRLSHFEEIPNIEKGKNYSLLGKGNFGYAEKMKSKINNMLYAIKKQVKDNPDFNITNFYRETEIMIDLEHENIDRFYGYFDDKEKIEKYKNIYESKEGIENETQDKEILCLVLEYIPNGSLENYYENYYKNNKNNTPINQDFIINIFKQILNALNYLKEKNILHRDIRFWTISII